MKPRLNRRHGVWACFTWQPRAFGCGRTPSEAYAEWRAALSSTGARS